MSFTYGSTWDNAISSVLVTKVPTSGTGSNGTYVDMYSATGYGGALLTLVNQSHTANNYWNLTSYSCSGGGCNAGNWNDSLSSFITGPR